MTISVELKGLCMPATPRRAERAPKPGSRFPSQVVAENMRQLRGSRRMSQSYLAGQMGLLGHNWTQRTVSAVEQGERHVNVDELASLALVLESSVPMLLDPLGDLDEALRSQTRAEIQTQVRNRLDIGTTTPLPAMFARDWLRGQASARLVVNGDETQVFAWRTTLIEDPDGTTSPKVTEDDKNRAGTDP